MRKTIFLPVVLLLAMSTFGQNRFSIATDIGLMRNLAKDHGFFTMGQTIQANLHFSARNSGYAWFSYYVPGKFNNTYQAQARDAATIPQAVNYRINSEWTMREVSVGLKHFFRGTYYSDAGINLYGLAGFGFMFARATNTIQLDTVLYHTPVRPVPGEKKFSRLNLDLGLGSEYPLGANIYLYGDLRTWINTSSYPSEVFHTTDNASFPLMFHFGVRLLFQ